MTTQFCPSGLEIITSNKHFPHLLFSFLYFVMIKYYSLQFVSSTERNVKYHHLFSLFPLFPSYYLGSRKLDRVQWQCLRAALKCNIRTLVIRRGERLAGRERNYEAIMLELQHQLGNNKQTIQTCHVSQSVSPAHLE